MLMLGTSSRSGGTMGRVERYHHGVEHQDASVHETVEQIAKITGESQAEARRLSAASYLECGIVLDSQRDPIISRGLDDLLQEAELVVQPVTERQARWPVRPTQISAKAAATPPV